MENDLQSLLGLRLEAEGRPGLFPMLQAAAGSVLAGRFRLGGLLAVGRQSFVFAALDLLSGCPVVVKQAAFDYRNPIRYGRAEADRLRQPLRTEDAVLRACTTGHLPQPVGLLTAPALVPAAAESPLLSGAEVYLVEEWIEGPTLAQAALGRWPQLPPPAREERARRVAAEFVVFWEALRAAGWHYGDLSASNLLADGGGLRVVDGGSAVRAGPEVRLSGFTPAFTTPRLLEALQEGRPVAGNLAAVLPPLAKILHFALTRREPFNGALPDLGEPALAQYSAACRQALGACLDLDAHPGRLPGALAELARWTGGRGA